MSESEINEELQHPYDFSGRAVGERIHRSYTQLPNWFGSGHSVGIATDEFLRAAARSNHLWTPQEWRCDRPDVFWKPIDPWVTLLVRKCGDFWTVERERGREETLIDSGYIVCARTKEAAMRLAEFCNPIPEGVQVGLHWIDTKW